MKQYTITNDGGSTRKIEGRVVKFNGFEEFDFILFHDYYAWNVTELKSGSKFVTGKTPNIVMKRAKHLLLELGRRQIRGAVTDNIKFYRD